jgi:hypothetical protein
MKLPIGIQTFSEIRENGYQYIDKTEQIYRFINRGKYYFLSRPRRFGKSLLVSTMKSLYEGQKSLFNNLWIMDHWDWKRKNPVIHIQFSKSDYQAKGLEAAILEELTYNGTQLGISLVENTLKSRFFELIQKAYKQQGKVVILVDEYDKPIIDYLDDLPKAYQNRNILKSFYSILKDSDPYLELVFITGVSRFARTSIFSDLNNLQNLTMDFTAADLLGITYEEVQQYFSKHLAKLAKANKQSYESYLQEMQFRYNGYSWDGVTKLYNPFSLLSFLQTGRFANYWFETGTPTFLINIMRQEKDFNLHELTVSEDAIDDYELDHLNTIAVLFQTGYLTVKERLKGGLYRLGYPNFEVQSSLEERLLNAYTYDRKERGKVHAFYLTEALKKGDIAKCIQIINSVFSTIPSNLWQKDNEAFYHALIHLTFSLAGVFVQSEINSSNGRLDAVVETADTVYIFEFKLDKSSKEALQQIIDRNYFQAFQNSSKKLVGIGVNFSKEKKEVADYLTQTF